MGYLVRTRLADAECVASKTSWVLRRVQGSTESRRDSACVRRPMHEVLTSQGLNVTVELFGN